MTAARITILTSDKAPLCKRFTLQGDKIVKQASAALYAGSAEVATASTAAQLSQILDRLDHRQAIATGILKTGTTAQIGTAAKSGKGMATRSLSDFQFPQAPGWLVWDYDDKSMPPEVAERVATLGGPVEALFHIWPEARTAAHVIRASSSDGITAPGQGSLHSAGLHGFILVQDVSQSRDILKTLEQRAWAAGLAWIALSKSGALLMRSIVDTAVGSPERLVFEAPPILIPPVVRIPRPAIVSEGMTVHAPALPLEASAAASQKVARARQVIAPAAEKTATRFIDSRAEAEANKTGKSFAEARSSIIQMMQGATLGDDHLLQMKSGRWVRVGDILDNSDQYNRTSLPDPIEGLDYGTDKATLLLKPRPGHPTDMPRLVSHAHGATTIYKFARYEAPPTPPYHPGPKVDRTAAIAAHGNKVRRFMTVNSGAIRASKAVADLYAEIDDLNPQKGARQRVARLKVQAETGLDYTPSTQARIPADWHRVLLSGAMGVGKSAALVGRNGAPGALHDTHGIVSLILGPDHGKVAELAADYEENRTPDAPPSFILQGRSQKVPGTNQSLCLIPKAAEKLAKKGGNVRGDLCMICPHKDSCGYLQNERRLQQLVEAGEGVAIFGPHEYAALPLPRGVSPDLVVIDEALRGHGTTTETIEIDSLSEPLRAEGSGRAVSKVGQAADMADAAAANLQTIQPLRIAIRNGFRDTPETPYAPLIARGLGVDAIKEAIQALALFQEGQLEESVKNAVSAWQFSQMAPGPGRGKSLEAAVEAAIDAEDTKQTRKVKALFEAVLKDLEKGLETPCAAWRVRHKGQWAPNIETAAVVALSVPQQAPVMMLDGTADPAMVASYLGAVTHHYHPVERNAHVVQVVGHGFSIQSITGMQKNGEPCNPERAAQVRRGIIDAAQRQPATLTVASLRAKEALTKAGLTGDSAHYGALRGRNTWEDCETVILAGVQAPPPSAVEEIARAYAAADPNAGPFQSLGEMPFPTQSRALRMADGSTQMVEVAYHPDPWGDRVLQQMRDAEALQAIDRARLIYNTTKKQVFILAPVALDLTINEVVQWSDFKAGGSRIERAIDQAGALPLARHPARRAFPELWESDGAAQRDLQNVVELIEGLTDQSVNNTILFTKWSLKSARLIEYQPAPIPGQRMRKQMALVWAEDAERARKRLEAVTGPLQHFSEVSGWIEARDALQDGIDAREERAAIQAESRVAPTLNRASSELPVDLEGASVPGAHDGAQVVPLPTQRSPFAFPENREATGRPASKKAEAATGGTR